MSICKRRKLCSLVFLSLITWIVLQILLVLLYEQEQDRNDENIQLQPSSSFADSKPDKTFLLTNKPEPHPRPDVPKTKEEHISMVTNVDEAEKVRDFNKVMIDKQESGLPANNALAKQTFVNADTHNKENLLVSIHEVNNIIQKARDDIETGRAKESKLNVVVLRDYDMRHANDINVIERKLKLFVAILSHPALSSRRTAIRNTWLKHCQSKEIICKFFTDAEDLQPSLLNRIKDEQREHDDLEFLSTSPGPLMSGLRMLQILRWVNKKHEPDFFLKIDDDRFLCVRRLLFDLEFRPLGYLVWGNIICQFKAVRMEESFLLLSGKLIRLFLTDEDTLPCHPYADQQTAIWLNNLKDHKIIYFEDIFRVHSYSSYKKPTSEGGSICTSYLTVHRVAEDKMKALWDASKNDSLEKYDIPPIVSNCRYKNEFDWKRICGDQKCHVKFEPKLCKDNPEWSTVTVTEEPTPTKKFMKGMRRHH